MKRMWLTAPESIAKTVAKANGHLMIRGGHIKSNPPNNYYKILINME
jgi:hypothetical protein